MRGNLCRAAASLSLVVTLCACNSPSAAPREDHAPPAEIDTRATLAYLASDELEGRGVGTKGLDRAADFIATEFRRIGLQPLPGQEEYFQSFEMTAAIEVGPKTSLKVADRAFTVKEDFEPTRFSGEGRFSGPVVFAGYGIKSDEHHYNDYAGVDVKGKVVLALRFEPHDEKGKSRFEDEGVSDNAALVSKAKTAKEAGAVAILFVTPAEFHGTEERLEMPGGHLADADKLPVIRVRQTLAEELLRRGGAGDLKSVQQKIDQSGKPASFALADVVLSGEIELVQKKLNVKNVVGLMPGKIRDEYVVVGAHYDHLGRGGVGSFNRGKSEIHNGADDNASGTTALLAIASKMARQETPKRSIIFAAFTAEEEGLIGSKRFVDHPPVSLSKINAMLNLDMVGRIKNTPPTFHPGAATSRPATTRAAATRRGAATRRRAATTRLAATTQASTQNAPGILGVGGWGTAVSFDAIIKRADERSPLAIKDIGKGGLGPSDHMSFALKKVPVLFFFSGVHADYHRPTDDADKINYQALEQTVDLVVDVVRQVAAEPKQEYIAAADAQSRRGSPSGGIRVTLGIVPDYGAGDAVGGVKISGTSPDSPAAKAGLKEGDIIVQWNAKKVDTLYDLTDFLSHGKPGEKVKLKLIRDGQAVETEATLVERK